MKELYVLVGVPGSGKTTWVKNQQWAKHYAYISTDKHVEDYARAVGKTYSQVFKEFMPQAVDMMTQDVIASREVGENIIWDQTSTSIATRAKKLRMLPDYYKVAIVFATPPSAELQKRLASRPGKEVPWEVVSEMAQKLEAEPVTEEEGFNEIWYV